MCCCSRYVKNCCHWSDVHCFDWQTVVQHLRVCENKSDIEHNRIVKKLHRPTLRTCLLPLNEYGDLSNKIKIR